MRTKTIFFSLILLFAVGFLGCSEDPDINNLGGHGRTYADFKNSSWEDWQEPIMTEYNALLAKGYTNINF